MAKLVLYGVLLTILSAIGQDQIPRPYTPGAKIQYPEDYCAQIQDYEEFDFIVVGSGPSGSIVARRLAEIPTNRVLLLEAGGGPPAISDVPGNAVKLGLDIRWKFQTILDEYECKGFIGNTCKLVPGMVLGGSSVVNYMMYVRGNPQDYDEWQRMGNLGWSYQDILPYFKKLENYIAQPVVGPGSGNYLAGNNIRGTSYNSINVSPLTIEVPSVSSQYHSVGGPFTGAAFELDPLTHQARLALFEAFEANGIQKNIDVNSGYQLGVTNLPGMVDALGYRYNVAKGYLLNIPDNLKVCKNALVHKVNIDPLTEPKVVTSVEFVHTLNPLIPIGRTLRAVATKEYIISAGPLNSPGILERSGIGIPEVLRSAGVDPLINLNVGENFQDQYINLASAFVVDYGSKTEANPLTIELTSLTAFLNITNPLNLAPDIQYILKTYVPEIGLGLFFKPDVAAQFDAVVAEKKHIMFFSDIILRQTKFGSVHIKQSVDPKKSPNIVSNQLSTRRDVDLTVQATRLARQIMSHESMRQFKPKPFILEECKGLAYNSEEEIMCGARMLAVTLYHQCGTCYMGPVDNPNSVVNAQLRVIGTRNLRVIDSSIMPLVPRGNTEVPSLMIGEKGADLVKLAWGQI